MKRLLGLSVVVLLSQLPACGGGDDDGGGGGGKGGQATAGSPAQAGGSGGSSAGMSSGGATSGGYSGTGGNATGTAGTVSGGNGTGGSAGGEFAALCAKKPIQICQGEFCEETFELTKKQFLQFFPACAPQWEANFDCIAKQPDANVTCENAKITSPACTAEQAALTACSN